MIQGEERDRILRRGDLARILGIQKGKLNDHKGDLSRVLRSYPNPDVSLSVTGSGSSDEPQTQTQTQTPDGHAFLYDVELVLGGKLTGVPRSELQYTTAAEEGMTGDSRGRRTRKAAAPKAVAAVAKKKSKNSNGNSNCASGTKSASATSNASRKRGKSTNTATAASNSNSNSNSNSSYYNSNQGGGGVGRNGGVGMFEKHRREFERSLARLQKLDVYNFFSDHHIPPEFDECYDEPDEPNDLNSTDNSNASASASASATENSKSEHDATMTTTPTTTTTMDTTTDTTTTTTTTDTPMPPASEPATDDEKQSGGVVFPDHPPYNFIVLRKRLERGRYILDRRHLVQNKGEQFSADRTERTRKQSSSSSSTTTSNISCSLQHPIGIHWELFRADVLGMCDTAVERNSDSFDDDGSAGTLSNAAEKIKSTMEQIYEKTGRRQSQEMEVANNAHIFTRVIEATENKEAAMQGKSWRKKAFPERQYKRLTTDAVCAGLSELDERIATYELRTSLRDSFIGLSYTYNDTGQSEGWMKTMLSETDDQNEQEKAARALSTDDGVIKAQVAASMQSLLIAVQDRVMTENGVLDQKELRSANWESGMEKVGEQVVSTSTRQGDSDSSKPEIVEQPVWGMDCYTRKNISICLKTKFDENTVLTFVEKWLLPAINACPVDLAYNLSNAARILEGLPLDTESSLDQRNPTTTEQWSTTLLGKTLIKKIQETGPPWLKCAAQTLRRAIESMGHDFFRVHPKGHGSIVLSPKIEPNRLVTFYRGEVYPSWRWGEKMDAIALIQQRNNLKPRLPDFYNMALERPQKDPRGYGLLFVDASRKSGYGSMLSHSCNPSCEVRVAAVNGKLTLAMTTLRELTIGDEVTFDYNAVTESLHEYQAAVCLCGQWHCRGSFLHFATADCYQQVLNRNSPIAVRLSQLIKGCTKKVMSDDDVAILERHGFQTAAFGAVSVNRRKATNSDFEHSSLDSMDFVPIWLRTVVADILRYIEYERRALPIALISNQISNHDDATAKANTSESNSGTTSDKKAGTNAATAKEASRSDAPLESIDDKPVKGSKPEPTFFYFLRRKRESFISQLLEDNKNATMTGGEIEREMKRLASSQWKSFGDDMKQHWKGQAIAEWEKNGGKEKALLEKQRLKRISELKDGTRKQSTTISETKEPPNTTKLKEETEVVEQSKIKKISFQAADAEGVTAMEQRIQQLTQALSRVGRVLDRHREELLRKQQSKIPSEGLQSPAELRELAHSPLTIMPDEHVVAWMWNHENGLVRTLLRMAQKDICVSPDMWSNLKQVESKYSILNDFGTPWEEGVVIKLPISPEKGRRHLDEALSEFRAALLDGIRDMATDIKNLRASAREEAKKRRERAERLKRRAEKIDNITTSCSETEIRYAIKFVLNGMIDTIEGSNSDDEVEQDDPEIVEPWLNNYNKRFKLEKAADLLLMYRRTSTFFRMVPYESLQSTPIEVYAREVGNAVPRSIMDVKEESKGLTEGELNTAVHEVDTSDETENQAKQPKEVKRSGLCEPEDIISEVVVDYQGDYVLSQLLQWYNAGIDQKPGLPDILGCALLPSMSGCWSIDTTKGSNSATGTRTSYQSSTRPKLVEWFKDPFKRGIPWADDLRRIFVDKEDNYIEKASQLWLPIGSPVLDFLVTGDDCNLMHVLRQLGTDAPTVENNDSNGLLSSVDHGRPAQAVSNWVQCENPECQKWRKIPWHVDIDMLSKKFVCSDHIWGLNPASCDAPEDDWDETTDACVEADGSVKPKDVEKSPLPTTDACDSQSVKTSYNITEFKIGTRFDVLRPGKEKWSVANVVDVASDSKKVKFHFVKTQTKNDVWLEEQSNRIAPLFTHTLQSKQRVPAKSQDPSTPEPECSEGKTQGVSKSEKLKKLKKLKASQIQRKRARLKVQPVESNIKDDDIDTSSIEPEKKRFKVRVDDHDDDDDDEGLYDVISSEDDDDDENEYESESEGGTENAHIEGADDIKNQSTGTDHSSSNGSVQVARSQHSDIENECTKGADDTKSVFTIPKKKESTKASSSSAIPKKNAIPKKPQPSLSGGTSLISNVMKQAMLEKKGEKRSGSHAKKNISLIQSSAKDRSNGRKNETRLAGKGEPSLKRKAFSDLCRSPSQHSRSPSSTGAKRGQSEIREGDNLRSPLSKAIVHPKRSYNDEYSKEQRRERELYRDSNEYTVRRENYNHHNSSDMHDHSNPRFDDHSDVAQRSLNFDRRGTDELERTFSPRNSSGRNCDSQNRHDQYEENGCHSRYHDRALYDYDDDTPSEYASRNIPNRRRDDYERHNDEFTNRRTNADDRCRDDYDRYDNYIRRNQDDSTSYGTRRLEDDHNRRGREFSDRALHRDEYHHRVDDEYEHRFISRPDDDDYYRVCDRDSKRRRHASGSRREERRRRTFDGSDEYLRRLQSYNQPNESNHLNEDTRRRDRYSR
eukprot:jgi/Psemu1/260181/estExt_Genewise1Plus.C_4290011